MSWSFNPFTGNLDLVGSGGSAAVFEGEVEAFSDLPDAVGNPPVGSSYLVRESTGVWLVNRKQAGIWIRRNNTGVRDTDWEYGGDYPVNSVNGQTGNVSLTAADVGITVGTTAGTVAAGDDARLSDSRNPTAHSASHLGGIKAWIIATDADLSGITEIVSIRADNAGTAGNSITINFDGVDNVNAAVATWNAANPSNTATVLQGGSQIPDNGQSVTLTNGANAAADPIVAANLDSLLVAGTDTGGFEFADIRLKGKTFFGNASGNTGMLAEGNAPFHPPSTFGFTGVNESVTAYRPLGFTTGYYAQLVLNTDGNVGVGTSTPAEKLHVNGSLLLSDSAIETTADYYDTIAGTSNVVWIKAVAAGEDWNSVTLNFDGATTINAAIASWNSGNPTLQIVLFDGDGTQTPSNGASASLSGGTSSRATFVAANNLSAARTYDLPDRSGELMLVGDAPASHTHELTALDATGATNGHVLTADGAGGVAFAAASGGGVTTGSVDNAILRADGTGGSTSQSSDIVIDDATTSTQNNVQIYNRHPAATSFAITAAESTDIITATGHTFVNNDCVVFTALAGGAGLELEPTRYFVRDVVAGTSFKVALAAGGSVINITVDYTSGSVELANSSIVLTPKGTGALIFGPKPAGTGQTGNARGAYAVDFGRVNFTAAYVASGTSSAILGGENNQASGSHSCVAGGQSNTASGGRSFCAGFANTASGLYSMAAGFRNTASGTYGATALGGYALADRQGLFAVSGGKAQWTTHSSNIVSQWATFIMHGKTTTNAAVELLGGDFNEGTARLTVPASRIMHGTLIITGAKSDGTAVARYMRQFSIKNVSGTTSLVGTVDTIGADEASGTSISVTANDTNDALKVEVTGITSETWRWNCVCHFGELTYGT